MLTLVLVLPTLLSALVLALALGGGWRRQLGLLVAGVAVAAVAAIVSLVTDCAGCTPEIGVVLAANGLAGWLTGMGVAVVVRRRVSRRPGRVLVGCALLLLALVAAVVGYGRNSMAILWWGCPTQVELQRVRSVEEVTAAFESSGVSLEAVSLAFALPRRGPAYDGAQAFRHAVPGATLYVAVCRQRCAFARHQIAYSRSPQRFYMGFIPGNNVVAWITHARNPSAAARLHEALGEPLSKVDTGIDSDSRCYIR